MRQRALQIIVLLLAALLSSHTPAWAWSAQGHRIIASVAYDRLTPHVRAEVDRLIASDSAHPIGGCPIRNFEDAADWPDCVRGQNGFGYLSRWHYDDIPLCVPVDRRRYCARGQCATAAIERAQRVLADRAGTDQDRLRALAELAHFIGDIHQPLHAENNNDRGGNDVRVRFLGSENFTNAEGEARPNNLHGVWDAPLVAIALGANEALGGARVGDLARTHGAEWARGDAQLWAAESHRLAVSFVYGRLPTAPICGRAPEAPIVVDQIYVNAAAPIVRMQLAKAAVRLALALERSLEH